MSIKETIQKGQKKWKEFDEKHPWVKPVLVTCALFGVGYVGYDLITKINDNYPLIQEPVNVLPKEPDVPKFENKPTTQELWENYYVEKYAPNMQKVIDFANSLELKPGEGYFINDQTNVQNINKLTNIENFVAIGRNSEGFDKTSVTQYLGVEDGRALVEIYNLNKGE